MHDARLWSRFCSDGQSSVPPSQPRGAKASGDRGEDWVCTPTWHTQPHSVCTHFISSIMKSKKINGSLLRNRADGAFNAVDFSKLIFIMPNHVPALSCLSRAQASRARAVSHLLQGLRLGPRPRKAHVRLPRAGCDWSRTQLVQFKLQLKVVFFLVFYFLCVAILPG